MIKVLTPVAAILLFVLIIPTNLLAQSTLWLLNGKKLTIANYKLQTIDSNYITLEYVNHKGKTKQISKDEVFSVTAPDGTEQLFYDALNNPDVHWQPDQMRQYLIGKAELYKRHKANGYLVGGIATGLAGVLIPPIEAEINDNGLYIPVGVIVPVAYLIAAGNITLTPEQIKKKYPGLSEDEYYLIGAQEGIEKKQLAKSLLGVGIGILAGFIAQPFIY